MNFKKVFLALTCALSTVNFCFADANKAGTTNTKKKESNPESKKDHTKDSKSHQKEEVNQKSDPLKTEDSFSETMKNKMLALFDPKTMVFSKEDHDKAEEIYTNIINRTHKEILDNPSSADNIMLLDLLNEMFMMLSSSPKVAYLVLQKALNESGEDLSGEYPVSCYFKSTILRFSQLFYICMAKKHNISIQEDKMEDLIKELQDKCPQDFSKISIWNARIARTNLQFRLNLANRIVNQMVSNINKNVKIILYSGDEPGIVAYPHGPASPEEISKLEYAVMLCVSTFLFSMLDQSFVEEMRSILVDLVKQNRDVDTTISTETNETNKTIQQKGKA